MLATINFNGNTRFHADKVQYVIANWVLSAKPVTLELAHS